MNNFLNTVLSYAYWMQENWKNHFTNIGSPYEPLTLAVQDLTIAEMCGGEKDMRTTIENYMSEITEYKDKRQYTLLTDLIESVRYLSFWYAEEHIHYTNGSKERNKHFNLDLSRFCASEYYRLKDVFDTKFADNEEAQEYFFNIDD